MAQTQPLHALLDQTGWIHALARRLVRDPHLAADLAQDTTMDALELPPDGSRPLRGWLATVMRNNLSKLRRGERNRAAREEFVQRGEPAPAAHEVVEKAETHRNVVLAVLALEEPYRSTLLMRFFEQLSYEEIARSTGVTRAAVNSRVTRGLLQLRQRLENTYGGDRRALCLALTPLAKLPTGIATTTLLGLKTMHVAIGTAAATLLAATVSVGAFGGGRAAHEPSLVATPSPSSVPSEEVELIAPLGLESARAELPVLPEQREQQKQAREHEADDNLWRTELSQTVALSATVKSLSVNSGTGDVEVKASLSGRVEILAKVRARLDKVSSEQLSQLFEDHVRIVEEEEALRVEDKHNNERGWSVSFVVSVPGELLVNANSGSGDIVVRSASGALRANTGSGDVLVELAMERLKTLSANTGSGDVVIEVASVEETLGANTGSGDVTVRIVDASSPGSSSMNTGSGDVHLIVPANIIGTFDLETHGDGIEMPRSLGIEVLRSNGGELSARGTVGNGGGSYKLRSGSGELRVELGNALPLEAR